MEMHAVPFGGDNGALNLVMEMHAVPLAKMKGLPKNPPDPENGNKGGFPTFFRTISSHIPFYLSQSFLLQ